MSFCPVKIKTLSPKNQVISCLCHKGQNYEIFEILSKTLLACMYFRQTQEPDGLLNQTAYPPLGTGLPPLLLSPCINLPWEGTTLCLFSGR